MRIRITNINNEHKKRHNLGVLYVLEKTWRSFFHGSRVRRKEIRRKTTMNHLASAKNETQCAEFMEGLTITRSSDILTHILESTQCRNPTQIYSKYFLCAFSRTFH
ncbi:hypothetical protein XELAEV_18004834mg [Xenopus laevis]|uniref:Uncharacterized protein n=1 Tax=Xenopus laevis TaxID=8355 RepID=A0A974I2A7_XENLA|nr:hypothetical protein XELAEV_18004834mg [Xenopus laevis]